jgi:hypothetical protein
MRRRNAYEQTPPSRLDAERANLMQPYQLVHALALGNGNRRGTYGRVNMDNEAESFVEPLIVDALQEMEAGESVEDDIKAFCEKEPGIDWVALGRSDPRARRVAGEADGAVKKEIASP